MFTEQRYEVIKGLTCYFFVSTTATEILEVLVDSISTYCDLTVQ